MKRDREGRHLVRRITKGALAPGVTRGVRYVPITPHLMSRWRSDFVCEKCRIACEKCDVPCSGSLGICGRCESKTMLERDELERSEGEEYHRNWIEQEMEIEMADVVHRRTKEREEDRWVEKENFKIFDKPPEPLPVPAWAQGRPDALTMTMDPRVQKVL